jgi:hypothetical protein
MKVRWMLAALLSFALLPAAAMATLARPATANAVPSAALPQDHDHDWHHDHNQDWEHHDWEHEARFEGRNPGYRQGYQDGFTDGHRDREAGRKWHYGPGYKHPDRGYRGESGDKHDYMREYKEGYEAAYRDGYGEHYREAYGDHH